MIIRRRKWPSNMEHHIAGYLRDIGESVEIFYEPRNEGDEWYVGLASTHGEPIPLHGHFGSLLEGLRWINKHKEVASPGKDTP